MGKVYFYLYMFFVTLYDEKEPIIKLYKHNAFKISVQFSMIIITKHYSITLTK